MKTLSFNHEDSQFLAGALSVGADDEDSPESGYRAAQSLIEALEGCEPGALLCIGFTYGVEPPDLGENGESSDAK